MLSVFYHQHHTPPLRLDILKDNKDGTVNLALPGEKKPVITSCPVTQTPEVGACVLDDSAERAAAAEAAEAAAKKAAEEAAKTSGK